MTDVNDPVEAALAALGEGFVPPVSPNGNGRHKRDADAVPNYGPECRLTDDFYGAVTHGPLGDRMRHVRTAAQARYICPTAAVLGVLGRVGAGIEHTVQLDPTGGTEQPLGLFVSYMGPPGSGKGTTMACVRSVFRPDTFASTLVPGLTDHMPLGSGQGMAEVFFDIVKEPDENGKMRDVKRMKRHNAMFVLAEGESLGALRAGESSTLMTTLREMFMGEETGQTNASKELKRSVMAGTYTISVALGFQPTKAGVLVNDVDGGTPQRFLFAPVTDPTLPLAAPDWPGPLDWELPGVNELAKIQVEGMHGYRRYYLTMDPTITDEIKVQRHAVSTGTLVLDPFDAHRNLLRSRVAANLALLDDALHITLAHWELAGMIMTASDATRAVTIEANIAEAVKIERRESRKLAARAGDSHDAVEQRKVIDLARTIAAKVHGQADGHWTRKKLRGSTTKTKLDYFDRGVEHALAEQWIVEVEGPGTSAASRVINAGPVKP